MPIVSPRLRVALLLVLTAGCRREGAGSDLVIAATGEPSTLVPPLIGETVGRDVADLVFEPLARLRPGGAPADPTAYLPALAASWTRVDSVTWRFALAGGRWHDGRPVTADDVAFSFAAALDTALGAPGAATLGGVRVAVEGAERVVVIFPAPTPDQLYDATQVRILPKHVWDSIPRAQWGSDASLARLVGTGSYRIASWQRGQSLIAERRSGTGFARIVWRFAGDQDAALNLVLSGEADILETAAGAAARERAAADSTVQLLTYPSAVAGFLAFQVGHPALADQRVRQALTHAIDRAALVRAVIGPDALVPPGPFSRALWIWDENVARLGFDSTRAASLLDQAGYRLAPNGTRRRAGALLTIDILVPSTSGIRRQLAEGIQQMWKGVGVGATITAVDFPVFQERLARGRFESMIGAWLDEPTPRGLGDQWTTAGIGVLNYGRFSNPGFDSLFRQAATEPDTARARLRWRVALDSLNSLAPAVFLYTPTNAAVVSRRLDGVTFDPFSWLGTVATWSKRP